MFVFASFDPQSVMFLQPTKRALVATTLFQAAVGSPLSLVPLKFRSLPLGSVKPAGWLYDQSDWIGGQSYYSYLEEAGSYWFDGLVTSSILMNHTVLKAKTRSFLEYVLDTQDPTGWLGPEVNTTKPRYLWGRCKDLAYGVAALALNPFVTRYPFFFGAIQMVEADPALTAAVVDALYKFVDLAYEMLKRGEGVDDWAATRWEDFVIVIQWLHEDHPRGKDDILLETMKMLKWSGISWEKVFLPENFPKGAVENISNPFPKLAWHGVNMAEGLKGLPSSYRFTHNASDIEVVSEGWDLLFKYHGRPSGIFAADEMLAGLEAVRGTELCLVVEMILSGTYLYQVIGDLKFADRVERITYNALPATLTGDMWTRQYLQQQNQVAAKNMTPNPFAEDGPGANIFGLAPEYPCCTVAFPKGWPKFIANAFMVTPDHKSLVHVYLGPFKVATTLDGDNDVDVVVKTVYPFGDKLTTSITASKAFTYFVRIPSWVDKGSYSINGLEATALSPLDGLQAISVDAGTTIIMMDLPAQVTTEQRPHGSVAIHRGALNYALDIPRRATVLARDPKENRAVDLQFDPVGVWQYAVDPSTVRATQIPVHGLPSPIFDHGRSPITLSILACPIDWPLAGDMFAAPPPENPACIGPRTTLTLSPYGVRNIPVYFWLFWISPNWINLSEQTTKLRISEFPVLSSLPTANLVDQVERERESQMEGFV
ncbi:hypothetical protein FISHEDRAFT_75713 [Fistulina hepatica ATCC 64428]|uniref:DUF1680-domain-containing protein n=1 Tax=Fistulina hepatica ATCC 64428 TaxID=1128425 RepID=A0A0D7A7N4_9AGAR|nr:hypothetical protein FISHEDRAFT_75713 [Fistulina hepatica ATCC 64428]